MAELIKGRKGGGSKQRTPTEQPDDLQSVAKAKILIALGEGEFAGGLTGRNIFLDGTPIENPDGSRNFSGVAWDFRPGTQAQPYIQGMPGSENEISVGTEVSGATAWTRTFTNTQLSAVRLRIKWPSLYQQLDNGDLVGNSVAYAVDLQTNGGAWQTVISTAVTGKTTTGYERSHRIDLPRGGSTWTLRLRKLTPDANSARIGDTMTLHSYTEVIDAKLRYPNTALLYIEFDSSQFSGSIPQISCEPAMRVIRVSGDVMASTGNAWIHFTATYYSAGLSRRIYQGVFRGPVGARVYHIEEIFTDSRVIPVANGGTGAATPAGARSALQLGDSATKNIGTGAGTVAAGDDSRIVNAASAKGSSYTGVIDFLNNSTSGDFGESVIVRAAHGQTIGSEFVNNVIKVFANDGAFTRFQHRVTTYHAARIVVAPVTGGAATFEFAQTGNAVASGAWVNAGSDERIKDDITPIESPRDILMNIRSATWRYRHKGSAGRFGIGVIANDLGKYFPEAVINTGPRELDDGTVIDDVLAVEAGDSGAMVAVHHAVLQSLVEENRTQQLEIEALKSDMEELKKMVEGFITK